MAQVNPAMPRVWGDSFIHVNDLDIIVEHEEPLLEWSASTPSSIHERIGEQVAKLVEDGSTIHAGMNAVCVEALRALKGKKDLGIHTDVLHDAFLELIESGGVTSRMKTKHAGRIIASFCIGTKRLYDLVRDNPQVQFYPTEHVNNPTVIAANDRMVSINSAVQVDITGQVMRGFERLPDIERYRRLRGFHGGYAHVRKRKAHRGHAFHQQGWETVPHRDTP